MDLYFREWLGGQMVFSAICLILVAALFLYLPLIPFPINTDFSLHDAGGSGSVDGAPR